MADEKLVTREEQVQERQRRAAREVAEAGERVMTDGPDGGHFIVDGRTVNHAGEEIGKAKGD